MGSRLDRFVVGDKNRRVNMKILVAIVMIMVLMVGSVYAEKPVKTEGTNWTTPSSSANSFLNKYGTHEHDVPQKRTEYGIGADIEYQFNKTHSVVLENKIDLNNRNDDSKLKYDHSHYLVYKLTLGN